METIETIDDVRRVHTGHWFDRSMMRFFQTRIPDARVYGGMYFISSEQFVDHTGWKAPRKYSIRRINPETGYISTVGKFNSYPSLKAARGAIWALLNEEDRNV